jgi:hypothetical protein
MKTGVPVRVRLNGEIEDIDSVDDAADFLQRWPVDRRGHVYRSALNACSAAIAAQIPASDAIKAFTGFARVTGILMPTDDLRMKPEGGTPQSRMPK